ncbi:MAG: co-chaperone GroES [Deltaproteobacteria bacterium]
MDKELIIVGDRVLIAPDDNQERTDTGLYLPQGVKEKEKVQAGRVVKVGPGYPIPDPSALEIEPWQTTKFDMKYFSLQAKEGDYCIFLRNAGIEIDFEQKKYVVVPHSAILVILREAPDLDNA